MKPIECTIENYQELVLEKKTHEVKTELGLPVRVLCTDRKDPDYPVVALVTEHDEEEMISFTVDGKINFSKRTSRYDLYLYPKPPKSLGWTVAYYW